MIAKGTVLSVDGNKARIRTFKESACGGCMNCENKDKCDAHFMLVDSYDNYECDAVNDIGAKVGDVVELYTPSPVSISLALIIFVLPVLITVAAYLLADIKFNGYIPLVIAVVAFFASFFAGSILANKFSAKKVNVLISKIIEENGNKAV